MNIACMLRDLHEKTLFRHTKWRDISACFNCFNNSFTFRFKRKLFTVCRSSLRHFRRFHLRVFYVFMIVAFAMNVTHVRTSHRDHVFCRLMKEERIMSWSLQSETEKERRIMWRACIEFNIWINIKVNTFILSHRMIRIWKEMTIILCTTTTVNTFHSKTIFEFRQHYFAVQVTTVIYSRTFIDQNDDQFLYLLILHSYYSLQSLFYINARVISIHLLRQVKFFLIRSMITKQQFETLLLFASLAVQKHDSKFLCFHSSTSSLFRRSWKLLMLCSAHDAWFDFVAILIASTSSIQAK